MKLVTSQIRQGLPTNPYSVSENIAGNRIFRAISETGRLRDVRLVVDPIRNNVLPRDILLHAHFRRVRGPGLFTLAVPSSGPSEGVTLRLRLRYLRYTVSKWWSGV